MVEVINNKRPNPRGGLIVTYGNGNSAKKNKNHYTKRKTLLRPLLLLLLLLGSCCMTTFSVWSVHQNIIDESNKKQKEEQGTTPAITPATMSSDGGSVVEHGIVKSVTIPRRLIFTHKTNLLEEDANRDGSPSSQSILRNNVLKTIRLYQIAFATIDSNSNSNVTTTTKNNETTVEVIFLTDEDCRSLIQIVNPQLVPWFDQETVGKYRADICRIADLYLNGGYYFDVDLEVIEPLVLEETEQEPIRTNGTSTTTATTQQQPQLQQFVTVLETSNFGASGFFQAFTAGVKGHPIFEYALEEMIQYYTSKINNNNSTTKTAEYYKKRGGNLGPITLFDAYKRYVVKEEVKLSPESSRNSGSDNGPDAKETDAGFQ